MKLTIERVAELCHGVNAEYCRAIGDSSQPSWEHAPQWQKDSAIDGVKFRLRYPDSDPSQSHNNWMNKKLDEGWTRGPVKDPVKKEHPCMVPFYELPPEQKAKDYLFCVVIEVLRHNEMIEEGS